MIDTSIFQGKKAKFYTLGCKLNFSETSTFARSLEEMGVTEAEKSEPADLCLINTCSVTGEADHKCRQLIHRVARENPEAFMVVTGCYAQLESATVAKIPGVNLVLGSNEKANLIQYLNDAWSLRLHHAQPDTAELDGGKDGGYYHHVKTKAALKIAEDGRMNMRRMVRAGMRERAAREYGSDIMRIEREVNRIPDPELPARQPAADDVPWKAGLIAAAGTAADEIVRKYGIGRQRVITKSMENELVLHSAGFLPEGRTPRLLTGWRRQFFEPACRGIMEKVRGSGASLSQPQDAS